MLKSPPIFRQSFRQSKKNTNNIFLSFFLDKILILPWIQKEQNKLPWYRKTGLSKIVNKIFRWIHIRSSFYLTKSPDKKQNIKSWVNNSWIANTCLHYNELNISQCLKIPNFASYLQPLLFWLCKYFDKKAKETKWRFQSKSFYHLYYTRNKSHLNWLDYLESANKKNISDFKRMSPIDLNWNEWLLFILI